MEIIFLVEEAEEGGYEAKALGYSIYTQAEDFNSLKEAVRDAVRCHFEEEESPQIIRLHIVKDEVMYTEEEMDKMIAEGSFLRKALDEGMEIPFIPDDCR